MGPFGWFLIVVELIAEFTEKSCHWYDVDLTLNKKKQIKKLTFNFFCKP